MPARSQQQPITIYGSESFADTRGNVQDQPTDAVIYDGLAVVTPTPPRGAAERCTVLVQAQRADLSAMTTASQITYRGVRWTAEGPPQRVGGPTAGRGVQHWRFTIASLASA